jgi:hypothetical protein
VKKDEKHYKRLDSSFLRKFALNELKSKRDVDISPCSDSIIKNEWEHFQKICEVANLIPSSLSFKVKARKTTYGIFDIPFSSLKYHDIEKLNSEAVRSRSYDIPSHILQPRYRTHYVHSFLVGALGWWMLHKIKFRGEFLCKHYERFIRRRYSSNGYDLWDIWWTIALLHDIGYPVSLFWKRVPLLLSLCYSYPQYPSDSVSGSYDNFIQGIHQSLLSETFEGDFLHYLSEWFNNIHYCMIDRLRSRVSKFDVVFREMIDMETRNFLQNIHISDIPVRDEKRGKKGGKPSLRDLLIKYYSDSRGLNPSENRFMQLDHGIASAILAIAYLQTPFLKDDPVAQLIFTPIVFHGLKTIRAEGKKEEIDVSVEIMEDFDIFFLRLVDQLQEWQRAILIEKTNEILIESSRIRLGPIYERKGYLDLEDMEVILVINNNRDVLVKSGWSFEVIKKDKQAAFAELRIDGKPLSLNFKLDVSSEFSCG